MDCPPYLRKHTSPAIIPGATLSSLGQHLARTRREPPRNEAFRLYTPFAAPTVSRRSGRLTYTRIINTNLVLSSSPSRPRWRPYYGVTTVALSRFHARSSRSLWQYQYIGTTIGTARSEQSRWRDGKKQINIYSVPLLKLRSIS